MLTGYQIKMLKILQKHISNETFEQSALAAAIQRKPKVSKLYILGKYN